MEVWKIEACIRIFEKKNNVNSTLDIYSAVFHASNIKIWIKVSEGNQKLLKTQQALPTAVQLLT